MAAAALLDVDIVEEEDIRVVVDTDDGAWLPNDERGRQRQWHRDDL
jgi:hypothetical protein